MPLQTTTADVFGAFHGIGERLQAAVLTFRTTHDREDAISLRVDGPGEDRDIDGPQKPGAAIDRLLTSLTEDHN